MGGAARKMDEPIIINVNGRTMTIERGTTAEHIIRSLGDAPENKTLMMYNQDGTFVPVNKPDRIETREGGRFHTILNQTGGKTG